MNRFSFICSGTNHVYFAHHSIHSRYVSTGMLAKFKNQMEFNRIQFLLLLLAFFLASVYCELLRLRYAPCIDKSGKLKCYFNYPWWNYGYRWKYFMMRFCWWHHQQHYHRCAYGSSGTDILDVMPGILSVFAFANIFTAYTHIEIQAWPHQISCEY